MCGTLPEGEERVTGSKPVDLRLEISLTDRTRHFLFKCFSAGILLRRSHFTSPLFLCREVRIGNISPKTRESLFCLSPFLHDRKVIYERFLKDPSFIPSVTVRTVEIIRLRDPVEINGISNASLLRCVFGNTSEERLDVEESLIDFRREPVDLQIGTENGDIRITPCTENIIFTAPLYELSYASLNGIPLFKSSVLLLMTLETCLFMIL